MGTPDPNNLYLGAGEVFFDRFDSSGASTGLRHLGNVEEFTHSASIDTIQKKSSMSGARGVLAEVITGSTSEITLSLNEYESKNLSLAFLGTEGAFTQSAEAGITDRVISATLELDRWYFLHDAAGGEIVNPTVTSFKQGATTIDAAGYDLRADVGMVKFLSSYTGTHPAAAGASTTWNGSTPAIVSGDHRRTVQALATGKILGRLRYVSAPDQANGPRMCVDAWNVNLKPDGDLGLIGSDFGVFKLKGTVQQDKTRASGEQYIRILYL